MLHFALLYSYPGGGIILGDVCSRHFASSSASGLPGRLPKRWSIIKTLLSTKELLVVLRSLMARINKNESRVILLSD